MIKAVTFDLDGLYFKDSSFRRFKSQLTSDTETADRVFFKSPEVIAFRTGKMAEEEFWTFAKKELNLTLTNSELFNLLVSSYERDEQVAAYVREVKSRGIKTCICSNNYISRIRELDKHFNFLQDFDVKIFSYEVGIMKPNIGICQALVDQANVKPEEIIYSDDQPTKLAGALELGINAFVYQGFDHFKQTVDDLLNTS